MQKIFCDMCGKEINIEDHENYYDLRMHGMTHDNSEPDVYIDAELCPPCFVTFKKELGFGRTLEVPY